MAAKTIQPVALEREIRASLPTSEAAFHLKREDGPLRPIRINGRLV